MNRLTGGAKHLITELADSGKRERAAQELIKLGAEAAPALIEALQTRDPNLLALYQQILVQIGSAATPALTKNLRAAHPLVRGHICDIFGQTKDRAAIPILLETLRGEFYTVRAKALLALGNIGDPQTVSALLPFLKDPEAMVRSCAATAIAKFRDQPLSMKLQTSYWTIPTSKYARRQPKRLAVRNIPLHCHI